MYLLRVFNIELISLCCCCRAIKVDLLVSTPDHDDDDDDDNCNNNLDVDRSCTVGSNNSNEIDDDDDDKCTAKCLPNNTLPLVILATIFYRSDESDVVVKFTALWLMLTINCPIFKWRI